MKIRNAVYEDLPLLTKIMVHSFRSAFSGFVSRETLEKSTVEENCFRLLESVFRDETMHFLTDGHSGMLVWQDAGTEVEIIAIHSLPESWGTGLGRALLETALDQIGDRPAFLWAFAENARARRFYEKNGFHWDGTQRVSEFDGAMEVRYTNAKGNSGNCDLSKCFDYECRGDLRSPAR